MDSDAFIRGLMGPYGGGKTSGCIWEIIQRGVQQNRDAGGVQRSRWAVVRNSYRQLEDSTIRTVHQWFPPHIHGVWKSSTHDYLIRSMTADTKFPNAEIELCFRALDRPDQIGNLLSTEYTGAWINEGRDVPWAVYEALMGRVGRYPAVRDGGCKWAGIIADTNPSDSDSKWYKFFEDADHSEAIEAFNKAILKRDPHARLLTPETFARCFKQPSGLSAAAENIANLQPGYYEKLAIGKADDWIKIYVHGQYGFTLEGKAVFPEYIDSWHCPDKPEFEPRTARGIPIYRSYDFGLTPACVFSQVTPTGRWLIVDEVVADDMGFDMFSDEVLAHSAEHYPFHKGDDWIDIGDPSGDSRVPTDEKTCFQIARAKGINMQSAPQTPLLRLEGTRKPMSMVVAGRPKFQLHPRCRRLRKALLGGYHYRRLKVSGERYGDKPDKNMHSHVADALCYAGAWLFGNSLQFGSAVAAQASDSPSRDVDPTRNFVTGY